MKKFLLPCIMLLIVTGCAKSESLPIGKHEDVVSEIIQSAQDAGLTPISSEPTLETADDGIAVYRYAADNANSILVTVDTSTDIVEMVEVAFDSTPFSGDSPEISGFHLWKIVSMTETKQEALVELDRLIENGTENFALDFYDTFAGSKCEYEFRMKDFCLSFKVTATE